MSCFFFLVLNPFAGVIPPGISLLSIAVSEPTEISTVLGDSYQSLNGAYFISPDQVRWKAHYASESTSAAGYETFSFLLPQTPVFLDFQTSQDLPPGDLDSSAAYDVATGWVLSPIRSGETLESLTQTAGMERLFAIFGLEGGVWRGKLLQAVGKTGEVYEEFFSSDSVEPLVELSSGRAYWMGFLPLGRRVSIASAATFPTGIAKARMRFGTSLDSFYIPSPPISFPGLRHTSSDGSWKGDLYVPDSASRIFTRLDSVAETTHLSLELDGPLLSVIDLPAGTQSLEVALLPLSRYSTQLALESSFKRDLSLREQNLDFLGPILSIDTGGGPSPLSRAAFPLLSTVLEDSSFQGMTYPDTETSTGALIHQIANRLLDDKNSSALEFLLDQGKSLSQQEERVSLRDQIYSGLQDDLQIAILLNELSNLSLSSWVTTPNLAQNPTQVILLNQFFLGNLEARVSEITEKTALLEPVHFSSFDFTGLPDALKFSLGSLGKTLNSSVTLTVRIENAAEPENHFALVKLNGFQLHTLSNYKVYAEFPQGQKFEFSFRVPGNNIVAASGESTNQSLDEKDVRTGRTNRLEIPIENYISKANGKFGLSIAEDFGMELNLILEFEGLDFLLHGSSSYGFSKMIIPGVRLNL